MEKRKLKITLEVLNEVRAEIPNYRSTFRAKVSQRKDISRRGNLYFYKSRSKELPHKKHVFYFVVLCFKIETF